MRLKNCVGNLLDEIFMEECPPMDLDPEEYRKFSDKTNITHAKNLF